MSDLRTVDTVASIRKNNMEEIRVRIARGTGFTLVDMRVFASTRRSQGEPKPTRAGICIPRDQLSALIEALRAAQQEAAQ